MVMAYDFSSIEQKWRQYWSDNKTFKAKEDSSLPKFYVLDMFPYPSGAGLHVGHPLGYIASDIYARYKRNCGYNVLHPMGYDAFGLPTEQHAIETGQNPAQVTLKNIARYREQLDLMGLSYDWDREIRTCDPSYYHWTQWAFLEMFNSYYDAKADKALPIAELVAQLERNGTETGEDWKSLGPLERENVLQSYRLAYRADGMVNWCAALGTVLANDEVKDGISGQRRTPRSAKKDGAVVSASE